MHICLSVKKINVRSQDRFWLKFSGSPDIWRRQLDFEYLRTKGRHQESKSMNNINNDSDNDNDNNQEP